MEITHKLFSLSNIMMAIMVFIIISMDIIMVNASWDETESMQVYDERVESKIKAMSGDDDGEKDDVMVEKFRALLGLRTLHNKIKPSENDSPAPSPSAIFVKAEPPAPTPAPAPAPVFHAHLYHHHHHHHHHGLPRPRPMLPIHKFHNQHKEHGKKKIILVSVLVSMGVVLFVFALGVLLWISRRMYHKKKVATRTASVSSDQGRNKDRSKSLTQNLASKVTHELNSDLFYIETLTNVLEPQTCMNGDSDSLDKSMAGNMGSTSNEKKGFDHETTRFETRERIVLWQKR